MFEAVDGVQKCVAAGPFPTVTKQQKLVKFGFVLKEFLGPARGVKARNGCRFARIFA